MPIVQKSDIEAQREIATEMESLELEVKAKQDELEDLKRQEEAAIYTLSKNSKRLGCRKRKSGRKGFRNIQDNSSKNRFTIHESHCSKHR